MSSRYCPAQHQFVLKFQCLSITKITTIQGRGDHVLRSTPSAQHQPVLRQTKLVCLGITIITKKPGRGASCWEGWASYVHVKCLLDVTVITIITKKQGRGASCWEGCTPLPI